MRYFFKISKHYAYIAKKSNKSVLMKIHPKKKPLYLIQQYKEANDVLHWQTTAMYPTDSNTADT